MLGYLFDPDYKAAKAEYKEAKSKRDKLQGYSSDITNDTYSINAINKKIEYVYEDFEKIIMDSTLRKSVSDKLNALKEPYQTNDNNLSNACSMISRERTHLKQIMDDAEDTMQAIKDQ